MSTGRRAAAFAPPRVTPERGVLPLAGREVDVLWRRHARARRVSLRVDPTSGGIVVTLPPRASRASGLALLHSHADWIASRLDALPGAIRFSAGAWVPLCGEPRLVRHEPLGRGGVWIGPDGALVVSGATEFLPRRIGDFLRAEARRRLVDTAERIGGSVALRPRRIAIKDTRTRWGSCTASGVVMFAWRLVMAPPDVQHYVVAHELAHLRHLDHGAAFWAFVDTLTPHRKTAEAWLHVHGAGLLRVG